MLVVFFFQAEDGIRDYKVTGVQTCALPIFAVRAVARYETSGRLFELATACEDAASILHEAGDRKGALEQLSRATGLFEQLGAAWDLGRALALERSLGVNRGKRGSRPKARVGWDALTPTEREVIELVCQALTNRQVAERLFVSPRTVQTHLSHVFEKINISS